MAQALAFVSVERGFRDHREGLPAVVGRSWWGIDFGLSVRFVLPASEGTGRELPTKPLQLAIPPHGLRV